MSIVGRDIADQSMQSDDAIYLGKTGATGIVQIQPGRHLSRPEIERYELYYAKNQSLLLDIEIMIKALQRAMRRGKASVE
jgi:lipopolysaccharide/colanic/teichoic acid biosynthesis glycosyltransferase